MNIDIIEYVSKMCDTKTLINMCCADKELHKILESELKNRESIIIRRTLHRMMCDIEMCSSRSSKQREYVHCLYRYILQNEHMKKIADLHKFWGVALKKLEYFETNGISKRKCAKYRKKLSKGYEIIE